ncbi:SDR family NAD(P)-dependent oxidoreductase [Paenibacillus radicis (ex Gao et al. 2016)]|uniref:Oxidoreductase n=1 Tax=Paenibacillus radicis (ex Gao et al. 2016) TaxID=1737354 RepID=A0A917GYZ1_9BACL|nr:SDR family oxidoreductase [Paenibacillus radicis (ex Gao et al. 2016)]GGG61984.1 oxidoreductase [Paenibacillus radicis (ex Gao et al. 2016)]
MKYSSSIVLVTGTGQGIGRAVALAYAAEGAKVIAVDRNAEAALQTVRDIQKAGGDAVSYTVDLSRPEEIEAMFADVRQQYGRLDILINNAGLSYCKSPYDITLEEWDYVLHTNLRGTFLCAREAAKIMREHGGGAIVNMASTRAMMSEPNSEAYAASKGGIISLSHALAVSFAADRIRVNTISPGWIENGDYSALREQDHTQHPSMRVGRPEDIVRACFYLTEPDNHFVNGINLVVDGGMTRKMIYEE